MRTPDDGTATRLADPESPGLVGWLDLARIAVVVALRYGGVIIGWPIRETLINSAQFPHD